MQPQEIKIHIESWINSSNTIDHFRGIDMAIHNCLLSQKSKHGQEIIDQLEHELSLSILRRMKAVGLPQRRPSCDEHMYENN